MIIEGLLTSKNQQGQLNVAPMGPIVDEDFNVLTLRPWAGSTTYENLLATRVGVFHVVDHVRLIAEAAIGRPISLPETFPAREIDGCVLEECCQWFEFRIRDVDTSEERAVMRADVVHSGSRQLFRGFNRARHAVIEAAILATRIHILPKDDIRTQLRFLSAAVQKTAGPEEQESFEMLLAHFEDAGVNLS